MITIKLHTFRVALLTAGVASMFDPALAQDATIAELTKPASSVSAGIGYWTDDRRQQGIYDGMRDRGPYGLLDLDVVKRDDATGTWLTFSGRNLGLTTREFRGEWLRQGDIGAFIEYSRIPRDNPYIVNTGLQGIGSDRLIVSGAGATAFGFGNIDLGTVRDVANLGFFKHLMPGLNFRVNFKNDRKEGTRMWGRGGAPEFAVEPIDSTTRQLDARLDYTGKVFQLSGGYYGSWYNNAYNLVNTTLNGGAAATQYFLSLPLDNEAHQVYLDGGMNFTASTRGTLKIQYTRATQDERLPTRDIAGLSLATAPTNLDGQVDTTLVQLGLTSRPTSRLSLAANLRYHDVREKTPQARYVQTGAGTCATTATCVDNTPLSFRTLTGKVEGTYRLPMQFSVIGGVDLRNQDRTIPVGAGSINVAGVDRQRYVPFRADIDETTYRVQLRRSMSETVNGSVAFLHSKRDGSAYSLTNETESDEINPIHIADRKRNKWRASLDWMPAEQLSFQFNIEDARDKYGTSAARPYGLRDGDAVLYSVDANYALNDKWQVNAYYSHDKTKATQFGQRATTGTAAPAEKLAQLEDVGNAFGVGVQGRTSERLRIGMDLQWIRNESKYPETITLTGAGTVFPAGITGPLPEIDNKLIRLKLFAAYALQKSSELRFDVIHERWETNDWTWQFANGTPFVYGTATDGTMVLADPKQTSNFVGVRYIHRFR